MHHKHSGGLRRSALIGLAAALALTACGGGETDAEGDGEDPTATAAAGETETGTGDDGDNGGLVVEGEEIADAELYAAAQGEGTLTLYTSTFEDAETELAHLFSEETGIEVEIFRVATNQLYERILTEHGAGELAADVIRIADPTFTTDLDDEGVFATYPSPLSDAIDDGFIYGDGAYYTTFIGPTSFGVNTEFLPTDEPPSSYQDLLDPAYEGEIAMQDLSVGITSWIFASYMRETYGIEYWEQIAAQDPILTEGNAQTADLLARGEVSVGLARPSSFLPVIADGAPVEIVWADAMPFFEFFMGVVEGSANPNAAKVFLNWNLSKQGQTAIAENMGEYAVREDVPPPVIDGFEFPPLADQPLFQPDMNIWLNERESWLGEARDIFS